MTWENRKPGVLVEGRDPTLLTKTSLLFLLPPGSKRSGRAQYTLVQPVVSVKLPSEGFELD